MNDGTTRFCLLVRHKNSDAEGSDCGNECLSNLEDESLVYLREKHPGNPTKRIESVGPGHVNFCLNGIQFCHKFDRTTRQ